MRTRTRKRERPAGQRGLCARLNDHVALEAKPSGEIAACFNGYLVGFGTFSAGACARAQDLRRGLPLASFASGRGEDKEIDLLVRRLARRGLLEYRLRRPTDDDIDEDIVVIEPQAADYWPRTPKLDNADVLVLSRFAYLRRRGTEMVLESPRAKALFRICDAQIAAAIASLASPQKVQRLRRQGGFPGTELLALLLDCEIVFKVDAAGDEGLRPTEGDADFVLWDFQDLLFHTRSSAGRHANPVGGVYAYAELMDPLPVVRPPWPGRKIDLGKVSSSETLSPAARLLRARHSTRTFDEQRPISLAELAQFLDGTARVLSIWKDDGEDSPAAEHSVRPYPSAGATYELELYLAVNRCDGLARGFYHYDAGGHALVLIETGKPEFDALLSAAQFAMDAPAAPQILITIAARFGRVSWKYSSLAYALILKDTGVLLQTFYLMATDMALGGCAIGSTNIDLFAKMTGIGFHVEGPVGQFALGRGVAGALDGPGAPAESERG